MIDATAAIRAIISLIIFGLIFWLLWWLLQQVALPEPFNKLARVILAVAAVIICIAILLSLAGMPLFHW